MSANHAKLVLALILVFSATALQAQNTATISGVVTDTTEAVVPGVEVIVVNSATGETYYRGRRSPSPCASFVRWRLGGGARSLTASSTSIKAIGFG